MKLSTVKLSINGVDPSAKTIKNVILASVGPAIGHTIKTADGEVPLYADNDTLVMFANLINDSQEPIRLTIDHSESVRDAIGQVILNTAHVDNGNLIADIQLNSASFERSTQYVGEYLMSVASDTPEFLNISLEFDLDPTKQEYSDGKAFIRPATCFAASIVAHGALTDTLFAFSRNKNGEHMTEEKKLEEVVEAKKQDAPQEAVPTVKAEEDPGAPDYLKAIHDKLDALSAKHDALMALCQKMMDDADGDNDVDEVDGTEGKVDDRGVMSAKKEEVKAAEKPVVVKEEPKAVVLLEDPGAIGENKMPDINKDNIGLHWKKYGDTLRNSKNLKW